MYVINGMCGGSAQPDFYLTFKLTDKILVILHNLRGYEIHFIMQETAKLNQDIKVIPSKMENYMAFMPGKHIVFIDSFQFMSSSLEKLVDNLPSESFKYTSQEFKNEKLDFF